MRLDDKDELERGLFKYWFACTKCDTTCTLDESTGNIDWGDSFSDNLPF